MPNLGPVKMYKHSKPIIVPVPRTLYSNYKTSRRLQQICQLRLGIQTLFLFLFFFLFSLLFSPASSLIIREVGRRKSQQEQIENINIWLVQYCSLVRPQLMRLF